MSKPTEPTEPMKSWRVKARVKGSLDLGIYEAPTRGEAEIKALDEHGGTFDHKCPWCGLYDYLSIEDADATPVTTDTNTEGGAA